MPIRPFGADPGGDDTAAVAAGSAKATSAKLAPDSAGTEGLVPVNSPDIANRRQVYSCPLLTSCRSQAERTEPSGPNASRSIASFWSTVQRRRPETRPTTSMRALIRPLV